MELIDKRIEYLDTLNSISSEKYQTTRGDLICQKAYDYCNATGRRDTVAYKMFKDGIALMGLDAEPIIFTEYVQCIINMYNDNLSNPNIADIRKQVIEDLLETNDTDRRRTILLLLPPFERRKYLGTVFAHLLVGHTGLFTELGTHVYELLHRHIVEKLAFIVTIPAVIGVDRTVPVGTEDRIIGHRHGTALTESVASHTIAVMRLPGYDIKRCAYKVRVP